MRKSVSLAALGAVAALVCALPAAASDFQLDPANTISVPTCSSGGGSSVSVTGGWYEVHVDSETANVCYAATCATGGMARRVGNHGVSYIPSGSISCRSTASSAAVQLVPAVKKL